MVGGEPLLGHGEHPEGIVVAQVLLRGHRQRGQVVTTGRHGTEAPPPVERRAGREFECLAELLVLLGPYIRDVLPRVNLGRHGTSSLSSRWALAQVMSVHVGPGRLRQASLVSSTRGCCNGCSVPKTTRRGPSRSTAM